MGEEEEEGGGGEGWGRRKVLNSVITIDPYT